jgi:hypothetical protein
MSGELNVFGVPIQRNIFGNPVNPTFGYRGNVLPRPYSRELTELLRIEKEYFSRLDDRDDDDRVDFRDYYNAHQEWLKSL